jgi:hypothetical protein
MKYPILGFIAMALLGVLLIVVGVSGYNANKEKQQPTVYAEGVVDVSSISIVDYKVVSIKVDGYTAEVNCLFVSQKYTAGTPVKPVGVSCDWPDRSKVIAPSAEAMP